MFLDRPSVSASVRPSGRACCLRNGLKDVDQILSKCSIPRLDKVFVF